MSTIKPHFDPYTIDNLKLKLSEKIGFSISNKPDCAKLSGMIGLAGNGYLSETTLYRLFFLSDKHKPNKNTLDILCQFIGYKDSIDLLEEVNSSRELLHTHGINTENNTWNSLIFHCIEHESYEPLDSFFDSIEDATHAFKSSVCISLFDSLMKSKKQIQFFKHFSKQKYIRTYFFEKGHDPKFRINDYDKAYGFYLDGIDNKNSIEHFQDYVFGNAVLFRYLFLKKDNHNAYKLGQKIYGNLSSLDEHRKDLYIFPFIRFTAYKLWYLQMSNAGKTLLEDYACYLLELCKSIKSKIEWVEKKILYHTVAEVFLHSSLPVSYHWELKTVFSNEFEKIPEIVFSKHLKHSLPYFEQNGLLYHRP